jgi:hypothetical protein
LRRYSKVKHAAAQALRKGSMTERSSASAAALGDGVDLVAAMHDELKSKAGNPKP